MLTSLDVSPPNQQSSTHFTMVRSEVAGQYEPVQQSAFQPLLMSERRIPMSQPTPVSSSSSDFEERLSFSCSPRLITPGSHQRFKNFGRRYTNPRISTSSNIPEDVNDKTHAPITPSTGAHRSPRFPQVNGFADSSWMPEIWLNRVTEIISHCMF